MDSYYSGDHITRDRIHTNTITCGIEEPQQKYHFGRVGMPVFKCYNACFNMFDHKKWYHIL